MSWMDEAIDRAEDLRAEAERKALNGHCAGTDSWRAGVAAIMNHAVTLVAARGGTMTAERLEKALSATSEESQILSDELREHIVSQGARNATLEAQVEALKRARDDFSRMCAERLDRACDAEKERDAARAEAEVLKGQLMLAKASVDGLHALMRVSRQGAEPTTQPPSVPCGVCKKVDCTCPGGPRWPCSPTCTHDDARTPGHPERVKERSDAVKGELNHASARTADWHTGYTDGYDTGVEAMRAACWVAAQSKLRENGYTDADEFWDVVKAAIEGATP